MRSSDFCARSAGPSEAPRRFSICRLTFLDGLTERKGRLSSLEQRAGQWELNDVPDPLLVALFRTPEGCQRVAGGQAERRPPDCSAGIPHPGGVPEVAAEHGGSISSATPPGSRGIFPGPPEVSSSPPATVCQPFRLRRCDLRNPNTEMRPSAKARCFPIRHQPPLTLSSFHARTTVKRARRRRQPPPRLGDAYCPCPRRG